MRHRDANGPLGAGDAALAAPDPYGVVDAKADGGGSGAVAGPLAGSAFWGGGKAAAGAEADGPGGASAEEGVEAETGG